MRIARQVHHTTCTANHHIIPEQYPAMGSLPTQAEQAYDVLIIGAGLSGICSLIHIRKRFPSWRVRVIEAGEDVGGTWYWNRYPGCRFDSESLSYGFSFDKDLLEEWHWKEAFSSQAETHKYIKRVAEKHNLYKDIQFNTKITTAHWNDTEHTWTFVDEAGDKYAARFFISCLGFLSSPTLPAIPGIEDFRGEAFHTSRWPRISTPVGTSPTNELVLLALAQQAFKPLQPHPKSQVSNLLVPSSGQRTGLHPSATRKSQSNRWPSTEWSTTPFSNAVLRRLLVSCIRQTLASRLT